MVFDFFGILIYLLNATLIGFAVKAYVNLQSIDKKGEVALLRIAQKYDFEKNKIRKNSDKLILANKFNESVINGLFKITNELLVIQKLVFNKCF